jgi:hypothetical protein
VGPLGQLGDALPSRGSGTMTTSAYSEPRNLRGRKLGLLFSVATSRPLCRNDFKSVCKPGCLSHNAKPPWGPNGRFAIGYQKGAPLRPQNVDLHPIDFVILLLMTRQLALWSLNRFCNEEIAVTHSPYLPTSELHKLYPPLGACGP